MRHRSHFCIHNDSKYLENSVSTHCHSFILWSTPLRARLPESLSSRTLGNQMIRLHNGLTFTAPLSLASSNVFRNLVIHTFGDPSLDVPASSRTVIFAMVPLCLLGVKLPMSLSSLKRPSLKLLAPQLMSRALHEYGLISRVRRSKPWISPANVAKRKAWAAAHSDWTVEDWKQVLFSDESKFMLFKSDGRQYCWMKPGQALDPRFTKKTVKHGGGNVMVWGCVTGEGMGRLHRIEGIMNGPGYVSILQQSLLGTLKDWKLKKTGKNKVIFQQDNDPKHASHVARDWFQKQKVSILP